MLDYENSANPYSERRETIANWKFHATKDISETEEILSCANSLTSRNIKSKDALHIACATELKCEYFITTDMALIKKCSNLKDIRVINPVEFVKTRNL